MSNFKPHPIGRFPFWADAESATETEAVGHHGGPHSAGTAPIRYTEVSGESWRVKDPSEVPINSGGGEGTLVSNAPLQAVSAGGPDGEGELIYLDAPLSILKDPDGNGGSGAPSGRMGGQAGPAPVAIGVAPIAVGDNGSFKGEPIYFDVPASKVVPDESTGNFTSTVREFFSQYDSVNGDALADEGEWLGNSPFSRDIQQDDGIQDGYLDVDSSAFNSITGAQPDDVIHTPNGSTITGLNPDDVVQANSSGFEVFLLQSGSDLIAPIAEPFADAAAITDLVTGKSSPMETATDPLVAAGPLDAVKVDEPRNNDF